MKKTFDKDEFDEEAFYGNLRSYNFLTFSRAVNI